MYLFRNYYKFVIMHVTQTLTVNVTRQRRNTVTAHARIDRYSSTNQIARFESTQFETFSNLQVQFIFVLVGVAVKRI